MIMIKLTNIKNNIKGNNTKNHDTGEYPDLHMRFNNQVQNNTYSIFTIKMSAIVGLSHMVPSIQKP